VNGVFDPANPLPQSRCARANALTVDVEDYFHVSAFRDRIDPKDWDGYESRVVANTRRTLDVFDDVGSRGTFFVLGWVAEREPELVREIVSRGHEVACHGFSHRLIYQQTPDEFRAETVRAKSILEDQSGAPVRGYRAASFSITAASRWALDVLVECGFEYDSSFFPVRHDLYGTDVESPLPHALTTPAGAMLVEFPMTVRRVLGVPIPVSGGGYFRMYPLALTKRLLRSGDGPFAFYLHPWELDPDQPRIAASWRSTFRHYTNLRSCERKLRELLATFPFAPMVDVLADAGLLSRVRAPASP
jgi:polysaccharide deacetylase family protein (PEP-CTERM system associated)